MGKGFDEYAPAYDAWFLENRNVLYSEINLVEIGRASCRERV